MVQAMSVHGDERQNRRKVVEKKNGVDWRVDDSAQPTADRGTGKELAAALQSTLAPLLVWR